jgi:hypothetical protein
MDPFTHHLEMREGEKERGRWKEMEGLNLDVHVCMIVCRFFTADPGMSVASSRGRDGRSGLGTAGWGEKDGSELLERGQRRDGNEVPAIGMDRDDGNDDDNDGSDFVKKENAMLLSELSTMDEEVERAETLLSEISSMNSFLTTKISEQAELVMELHRLAESATESIKLGRKELEKAMKRGVDFRMFVLLSLVMASLSLLFLDWYVG